MTLFQQYELLEFILNKDFNGNILTPKRFNQAIKAVNLSLFQKKLGSKTSQLSGVLPPDYGEIDSANANDLRNFKAQVLNAPVTGGILTYPEDYARQDTLSYRRNVTIDTVVTPILKRISILRQSQAEELRASYLKRPSEENPIATLGALGFMIYPETISLVDLYYWRWPRTPVFEYVQKTGYIEEASTSVEYEWPETVHLVLVSMTLEYFGINLRGKDILEYAQLKERKES